MSHKKAGGSAKNLTDSKPKYLGTKLYDGQVAKVGSIIVRQRGTKILAGKNVAMGKDHTLFSIKSGKVKFSEIRKGKFDGSTKRIKVANIE
ncbi:MAG: 50S ribosomal protein L27 [Patescibacteria group bacterium]